MLLAESSERLPGLVPLPPPACQPGFKNHLAAILFPSCGVNRVVMENSGVAEIHQVGDFWLVFS